jgi:hypothetical protein
MTFRFIHTADWQIGKAFGRFPAEGGVRLRAARLDAIDTLAALARTHGAGHVLVAGDVIDSEHIDDRSLREPFGRMAVHGDIRWHLLPGNHDPARAGGIWGRVQRFGLPANVVTLLEAQPSEIEPGVVLLPAPLAAKETSSDPTAWFDTAPVPDGAIRIGVAHGSVRGFGSLGEAAVPIDAGRRQSAGLDYLALGDWHGLKEIGAGVWYSGTPEPDSFGDNALGHAIVVGIKGRGAPPAVTPVETASLIWMERRAVMARAADLEPIEQEIGRLGTRQSRLVLALALSGRVSVREAGLIDAVLARLASVPVAVDIDRRRLGIAISGDDVAAISDPALARVASRLKHRAETSDPAEAAAAGRAMLLLAGLVAETEPQP